MEDVLKQLLQEEQDLQFKKFNADVAWRIGSKLVLRATSEALPITIDIMLGTHQLFHYSCPGTAPDNDEWVKRKVRLAYRVGHSSFYVGELLRSKGNTIEQAYLLGESEYAPHGGCFPVFIKGSGMIGTITISGLPQEEDHRIVVEAIRDYLQQEN